MMTRDFASGLIGIVGVYASLGSVCSCMHLGHLWPALFLFGLAAFNWVMAFLNFRRWAYGIPPTLPC